MSAALVVIIIGLICLRIAYILDGYDAYTAQKLEDYEDADSEDIAPYLRICNKPLSDKYVGTLL